MTEKGLTEKLVFVTSDWHAPYYDITLNKKRIRWARKLRADNPDAYIELVLNGDIYDCLHFGTYDKNDFLTGKFASVLEDCMRTCINPLTSALQPDKVVYMEGNHEDRVYRYVTKNAPALQGSVDVSDVLGMKWADEYYPYRGTQDELKDNAWVAASPTAYKPADNVYIIHGNVARKAAGASVNAEMGFFPGHVIMGHCHRTAIVANRRANGTFYGLEIGCSCDFSRVPKGSPVFNWNTAIGALLRIRKTAQGIQMEPRILSEVELRA